MAKSCCLKGCHNRQNRTGLALLFDPKCDDQQRKRNGRADNKATKRMAGSTETQRPRVHHAWKGEERWMYGKSKARRTVCSDYFVHGMFIIIIFYLFTIVFSAKLSDNSNPMICKRRVCVCVCVLLTLHLYNN